MLKKIIGRISDTKSISDSDFSELAAVIEKIIKSTPSFYFKKRTIDDFKDILMEAAVAFYERLTGNEDEVHNPESYLYTLVNNTIKAYDRNIFNKEFLYFKEIFDKELLKVKSSSNNAIDHSFSRVAEKEEIYNFEEFNLIELKQFSRYTSEVKEELQKLIKHIMCTSDIRLTDSEIFKKTCDIISIKVHHTINIYDPDCRTDEYLNSNEILDGESDSIINNSIQMFISQIKSTYESLPKSHYEYAALWYYRIVKQYTLKEIADRLNYLSPNNIDYYVRKYGIEEQYRELIREICNAVDIIETGELILHVVNKIDLAIEHFYNSTAGDFYEG